MAELLWLSPLVRCYCFLVSTFPGAQHRVAFVHCTVVTLRALLPCHSFTPRPFREELQDTSCLGLQNLWGHVDVGRSPFTS